MVCEFYYSVFKIMHQVRDYFHLYFINWEIVLKIASNYLKVPWLGIINFRVHIYFFQALYRSLELKFYAI